MVLPPANPRVNLARFWTEAAAGHQALAQGVATRRLGQAAYNPRDNLVSADEQSPR
jgi:hypothetical protein